MPEWTTNNWIQLIVYISSFAVAFSSLKTKTDHMSQKFTEDIHNLTNMISRLEEKQDKHNEFMKRMAVVENVANNNKENYTNIEKRLHNLEVAVAVLQKDAGH